MRAQNVKTEEVSSFGHLKTKNFVKFSYHMKHKDGRSTLTSPAPDSMSTSRTEIDLLEPVSLSSAAFE